MKKRKLQIAALGMVGLIGAGSLFGGLALSPVYAQEEEIQDTSVISPEDESSLENENENVNETTTDAAEAAEDSESTEASDDRSQAGENKDNADEKDDTDEDCVNAALNKNSVDKYDKFEKEEKEVEVNVQEQDKSDDKGIKQDNQEKVLADVDQATYPITVKTDLSDLNLEWALKDPSVLANTDIKLYKLDYSEYKKIIEDNGGLMGATQGEIWNQTKKKAQLIESWKASESSHTINISGGDYYIAVNDTLYGISEPVLYFNISEDGKKITSFDTYPSEYEKEPSIIYKDETASSERVLSVKIGYYDFWAKYVDPKITFVNKNGSSISGDVEVEIYRKDGDSLTKIDRVNKNDEGYDENYIDIFIEHPGVFIIRCVSAPEGYKKFSDITIKTKTNEYGYPELEVLEDGGNTVNIHGLSGGEYLYWRKFINPAVIEIALDYENAVKANVQILTEADFSSYNLRHSEVENWAEVLTEYNNVSGVENKLYRMSFNTWKNMVEEVTQQGGGGNAYADNIRAAIKQKGEYVTSWKSSDSPFNIALEPSVYAIMNDVIDGNTQVTFFQIYEDGTVRYCPEYTEWYDESLGIERYEWGKSGAVDEGNLVYHNVLLYENKDTVTFKITDTAGNNITTGVDIELYRKEGDKLTKIGIEKAKGGHCAADHICGLIDYPGTYVIKCVNAPAGYKVFSDITFTVSRKEDGYPSYELTDKNGNTVYLKGVDEQLGEQDSPYYGAQEAINALFEIVLGYSGGSSQQGKVTSSSVYGTSASNTVAAKTASATGVSAASVSAAKTGERNHIGLWAAIGVGAAAVAGVLVLKRRRKED